VSVSKPRLLTSEVSALSTPQTKNSSRLFSPKLKLLSQDILLISGKNFSAHFKQAIDLDLSLCYPSKITIEIDVSV
jgi:hypothetical protein